MISKKQYSQCQKMSIKLIVMFFGLTNLLAIFQMIMNNLLKDLIKIRYVVAFINDIMIEMEIEKETQ